MAVRHPRADSSRGRTGFSTARRSAAGSRERHLLQRRLRGRFHRRPRIFDTGEGESSIPEASGSGATGISTGRAARREFPAEPCIDSAGRRAPGASRIRWRRRAPLPSGASSRLPTDTFTGPPVRRCQHGTVYRWTRRVSTSSCTPSSRPKARPDLSPDRVAAGNAPRNTRNGGQYGMGTAFSSNAEGEVTVFHDFAAGRWVQPGQGLVDGEDGFFYGVDDRSGAEGQGTSSGWTPPASHTCSTISPRPRAARLSGSSGVRMAISTATTARRRQTRCAGAFTPLHAVLVSVCVRQRHPGLRRKPLRHDYYGGAFTFGTVFRLTPTGRPGRRSTSSRGSKERFRSAGSSRRATESCMVRPATAA